MTEKASNIEFSTAELELMESLLNDVAEYCPDVKSANALKAKIHIAIERSKNVIHGRDSSQDFCD